MRTFATLTSALAAISVVSAQTFTDCDPTKKECPNNPGLNQADYTVDFSKGLPSDWTATSGSIDGTADGGRFRIAKSGDGPTVQSNWYFFYGRVDVKFRAAPGAGIVSSLVFQSSDLDEVDWEWIGSETTRAQSNYFGKGNTTTYDRGGFHNVANPATTWHTYSIDWSKDKIVWYIDNAPVRTLNYADANGGHTFPQTPMNIRIGNWIGGSPGNAPGTIEWAGGLVDLSKGPFDMYVSTLTLKNYNPGSEYKYGDRSGSTDSIQIINNGKTSTIVGNKETAQDSGSSASVSGQSSATPTPSADANSASPSYTGVPVISLGGSNVSVPTTKVQTPTVVLPTSTPKSSIVPSTGGASGLQVQGLGMSLLAVFALFLAL